MSDGLQVEQILAKLTEATTDALFNLPALLTTRVWSKVAPAYLYSFQYSGESKIHGSTFLNGLPLVSSSAPDKNKIAHGDELIYLLDARDIFAKPIENSMVSARTVRIQHTTTRTTNHLKLYFWIVFFISFSSPAAEKYDGQKSSGDFLEYDSEICVSE